MKSYPRSACLSVPVQSLKWKGMRVRRKRGRQRTYGVWRPSFLPLPSSPLFPLISHTWDHYSSWNQHPTKNLLSLISSLSLFLLSPLLHPYALISLSPFLSRSLLQSAPSLLSSVVWSLIAYKLIFFLDSSFFTFSHLTTTHRISIGQNTVKAECEI